jgi:hypothetical protein
MTALETKFLDLAERLVAKFPASATLITRTGATYSPSSGNTSGEVTTTTTLTVSTPTDMTVQYIDNESVTSEDLLTYAPTNNLGGVVPKPGDRITIGSTTYTVLKVFPLRVSSVVACYALAVRA